jgi:N-acetylneuraminic acid mutarotase
MVLFRIAGYTRSTEVFDIENQVWHSNLIGKMTDNIRGFCTITTGDSIYLLGGFSDIQRDYTKNIWKWVSGQPTFQIVGQLLQTRMNSASVIENGKIYTIGGLDNLKAELFDTDADVSSSLNSMTSPQIFSQLIPRAFLQC